MNGTEIFLRVGMRALTVPIHHDRNFLSLGLLIFRVIGGEKGELSVGDVLSFYRDHEKILQADCVRCACVMKWVDKWSCLLPIIQM